MNEWIDIVLNSDTGGSPGGAEQTVFLMLLSLVLGQVIGWTYMLTHRSLSYSQTFTSSLVILPVIVSFLMMLMVGSLAVTFGLLAVFAVVRFRNVLKDTRDTTFILWAIVEGMAVGTGRPSMALIGLLIIALVMAYVGVTKFGAVRKYDVVVNIVCEGSSPHELITSLFRRHALRTKLSAANEAGDNVMDFSYRLLLRDPNRSTELQSELESTTGVKQVALFMHGDESEV